MPRNNEPYRYAKPELMRKKFTALNILPQCRRSTGAVRSTKPELADVYNAAGLPQVTMPERLYPGERRILRNNNLRQFVRELYQPPAKKPGRKKSSGRPAGRPA